ncbi:hypothetical protein EYF80_042124 [Liparis tanakae]|uniref:Uncharacterized protein n=1 Tax=Liparis tanakae TaxID=230148 RepID=A0A4Z2G316_9TELE|nr:hypothetical protein EYF80_042124 [Liparis tanakae]
MMTPSYLPSSSPSAPSSTQGAQAPPRRPGSARGSSGGKYTGTAAASRSISRRTTSGRRSARSRRSHGSAVMLNSQTFFSAEVLGNSRFHQRPGRGFGDPPPASQQRAVNERHPADPALPVRALENKQTTTKQEVRELAKIRVRLPYGGLATSRGRGEVAARSPGYLPASQRPVAPARERLGAVVGGVDDDAVPVTLRTASSTVDTMAANFLRATLAMSRESSRKSGRSVGSWLSRILRALCVNSVVEYFPSWPQATPSSSWRS